MEIKIVSYKNINGLKFGAHRDSVVTFFGKKVSEFKKSKFSKNTTDDFGFCHVFYDLLNTVEAIEFFQHIKNTLILEGHDLLNKPYYDLKTFIEKFDTDIEISEDGFTSKKMGIGVYAPDQNDVESIIVFKKGYYDI